MTDMRVETIGTEGQPLVILDDFAPDPDALRHFAAAADVAPALNHSPGVRAEQPEDYLAAQLPAIGAAAAAALGRKGASQDADVCCEDERGAGRGRVGQKR